MAYCGKARLGTARQAGLGWARHGKAWLGMAGQDDVGYGAAGIVWRRTKLKGELCGI